MPYIADHELRKALDKIVDEMALCCEPDGSLNYLLFAYCKRHVKPSYTNYKNFKAELRECADIIHTELMVPYEQRKKELNGDVTGSY